MRFQKKRLQQYLAICILTFGFLNTFLVNRANAQSVSQVQIVGIPPVAKTPYLNSLKKNFEAGLYRVQFLYSSPSMQPKNFKFKVSLTRDGNSILDLTSNPKQFSPGMHTFTSFFEDISFPQSVSDILSGIDSQLKKQVLQEGTIPEGTYRLEIKAIPATQTTGVSVVPGISSFSVRLPNPPILITPSDGSNVTQAIPTFAWTPVTTGLPGSLEYHLLIVEVLSGQTPLQAINGNRPMADHVLNNVTTYSYTPDNLPLEKGHKYAWQITAKDPNGDIPIKDNGQSEIHTFVFGQSKSDNNQVAGSLKDLKNITLIPGFAKLTGVQGLSAQEQGNTYVLSGQANLELTVSTSSKPYEATVAVNRLVIQKGSILHPVILGGAISASNVPLPVSLKSHKSTVRLKQLKWQLGQSVTVSADLVGPDGKKYPGKGKLTWSKNGLSGTITAKGSRQNPIMTFGKNPFQMYVTGFRMTFPGGQMVASGEVDLFNGETVFNLPSIGLDQDTVFANVTGTVKKPIYPVPNSQIMRIDLNSANGSFAFSRKTGKGHYDVQFQGSVGFLEGPNHYCGADALMQMSSANGFSIKNVNPNCDLSHPGIDLAGLKMKFTNPSIPLLSYDSSSDKWNFKFKMDALLDFPALNGFQLPKLKGVTISPGGIEFPKLTLSQSTLQSIPAFSIGKFKMNLTAFHMPHFTFPAFGSKDEKSKGWKFDMNFKMHWPKKGLGKLPPCLLDKDLTVKHAGLKNGAISGSIDAQVLDSCRVPLGPDYALILENLSGKVGIKLSTNPSVTSQLKLQASLEMGDPFNCDNQNGPMSLGNTDLTLHSDGHITGTVKNLVPKCPLNVGPYQATVKTAELDLTDTNGNQGAVLSTTATLHLGDHQSVDGVAAVDLTTGKFSKLSFDMNKPFDWSVPKKNPVFVFHINKAHIGLDGLKIDGRQKLKLQNSSTDVTFDHMVLNL
ncbi:MAG TPA: hypothetical protein VJ991_02695, partial [Balneolales bacterium]|nr:hypothetical protein [Balneolales bacterium]